MGTAQHLNSLAALTMIPVIPERRPRPSYGAPSIFAHAFHCLHLASNSALAASNVIREADRELAVNCLLPVRNGRRQNPRRRMFVWNEAQFLSCVDSWRKACFAWIPRKEAACGRSAGPVTEPEPETSLSNPQDLWVALANESRVRSRLLAAAAIGRRQFAR